MEPVMHRLLSNCRRLLSDRRGNIAILFGLAVVPIFGIMGAALDYSMANMQRTALQAAADNTVLALSKLMPMSDEDLNTNGWKLLQANIGSNPLQYGETNLAIHSTANGKLDLQINTLYPLTLGSRSMCTPKSSGATRAFVSRSCSTTRCRWTNPAR
jgi:Flp pilus assembly protein TadG